MTASGRVQVCHIVNRFGITFVLCVSKCFLVLNNFGIIRKFVTALQLLYIRKGKKKCVNILN